MRIKGTVHVRYLPQAQVLLKHVSSSKYQRARAGGDLSHHLMQLLSTPTRPQNFWVSSSEMQMHGLHFQIC